MPLQNADHIASEKGNFEPQRSNNFTFEVALGQADRDLIELGLQSIPLPNESNDEIEIQFQNEKRYVAGQYTVDSTTLIVRDFVDSDTRGAIMRWRKLVYDALTGNVGFAMGAAMMWPLLFLWAFAKRWKKRPSS